MVCFTSGTDELVDCCCCCLSNEYIHTLQGICQCLDSCRGNIADKLRVDILITYKLNQRAQVMETTRKKKKEWDILLLNTILNSKVASYPQMPFN